jgi:hypothetical protein
MKTFTIKVNDQTIAGHAFMIMFEELLKTHNGRGLEVLETDMEKLLKYVKKKKKEIE